MDVAIILTIVVVLMVVALASYPGSSRKGRHEGHSNSFVPIGDSGWSGEGGAGPSDCGNGGASDGGAGCDGGGD